VKNGLVAALVVLLASIGNSSSAQQHELHEFPRSFYAEGLDIEVSQKELGVAGPYALYGVRFEVRKGENIILDETREITGELQAAWVTDLDRDRNPEILTWVRGHGSGGYAHFTIYEFEGKKLITVELPPMTAEQSDGYAGHDQITTSPSNVIRKYRKYAAGDANCCPTGPTMEITYAYDGERLVVERSRVVAEKKEN
jgi:hypothetical protein